MYWEQLESRRQSRRHLLYRRPYTLPSSSMEGIGGDAALRGIAEGGECACCTDDYGFPTHPSGDALYPYTLWDTLDDRLEPSLWHVEELALFVHLENMMQSRKHDTLLF